VPSGTSAAFVSFSHSSILFPLTPSHVQIVTFDGVGVSGHPNHIAAHRGVRHLVAMIKEANAKVLIEKEEGREEEDDEEESEDRRLCALKGLKAFELQSTNIFRKYIGILDMPITMITNPDVLVCSPSSALHAHRAMTAHWSQFVWFRRLFVVFSRFSYINSLSLIDG